MRNRLSPHGTGLGSKNFHYCAAQGGYCMKTYFISLCVTAAVGIILGIVGAIRKHYGLMGLSCILMSLAVFLLMLAGIILMAKGLLGG